MLTSHTWEGLIGPSLEEGLEVEDIMDTIQQGSGRPSQENSWPIACKTSSTCLAPMGCKLQDRGPWW